MFFPLSYYYLDAFLQKPCASQKLRELVITGLAHLVMANSESGFKQCLPLAYDPDHRKRTIFAYVFARVIGQGTVFDPVDKPLTKTRHTSLCEVSFQNPPSYICSILVLCFSWLEVMV
jgi:hypothetical protein